MIVDDGRSGESACVELGYLRLQNDIPSLAGVGRIGPYGFSYVATHKWLCALIPHSPFCLSLNPWFMAVKFARMRGMVVLA